MQNIVLREGGIQCTLLDDTTVITSISISFTSIKQMTWEASMTKFDNMTKNITDSVLWEFLLAKGFTTGTCIHSHIGTGFTAGFYSTDNLYYTRVFINEEVIHFYKEYDCGGFINEDSYIISMDGDWKAQIEEAFERFNFE